MKKAYLNWLIPVMILYVMVGMACLLFGDFFKHEVIETELSFLSKSLAEGLNSTDVIVQTAVDYNDAMAVCFINFDLSENKDDMVPYLAHMAKNEYVRTSVVCDLEGKGFDNKGNPVDLEGEAFFLDVQSKYSNGGKGFSQNYEEGVFPQNSLVIVNQVDFSNGERGFLITDMDISSMASNLLPDENHYDRIVLVSMTGQIIAGQDGGANFFDKKIEGLQEDVIKLNISQKKEMISEIPGYGYLILEPSSVTSFATVALITKEDLEAIPAVQWRLARYRWFVLALVLIIVVYVSINLFGYYIISFVKKKREEKENKSIKIDQLTELYNEFGVKDEIQKYISGQGTDRGAVLFALSVELEDQRDYEEVMKALAETIPNKHRATDILGRGDDNSFFIFLKDIIEAKDIRKQMDELQLFLYDFKTDMMNNDKKVKISAGRAIYPKDGNTAEELLKSARGALKKSPEDGNGSISINS